MVSGVGYCNFTTSRSRAQYPYWGIDNHSVPTSGISSEPPEIHFGVHWKAVEQVVQQVPGAPRGEQHTTRA